MSREVKVYSAKNPFKPTRTVTQGGRSGKSRRTPFCGPLVIKGRSEQKHRQKVEGVPIR